jgi:DNA-binding NtrC family response regulator
MRILVVDDEEMKRRSLHEDLAAWGHEVTACADGQAALACLERALFDVVVTDLKMPALGGMDLLERAKAGPNVACDFILITAYGSIPVAVEAMKKGAFDFLTKPFSNELLLPILRRIETIREESRQKREESACLAGGRAEGFVVGSSPAMRRVLELVEICARTESNVLLCGETGTGKDLVASVIHKKSPRHACPFVKVSCALFPHDLFASELYGHERGAFTGADRTRLGRFDLAAGGTLYLDDVDDIPYAEQVKLVRVIEDRVFERVGATTPIRAQVRIIASSKVDLLEKIAEGTFREDLYYRLDVMRIDLPPLRERVEDIPELAAHVLRRLSGSEKDVIDPEIAGVLASYHWPGNVRELRNVLECAWLTGHGTISADQLVQQLGGRETRTNGEPAFQQRVDRFERELLLGALKASGGNKTAAARLLGMKPTTLRDKLERLGLS